MDIREYTLADRKLLGKGTATVAIVMEGAKPIYLPRPLLLAASTKASAM